ncbi:hypothetical protein BVX99_03100, partial [bacterium F16]
MRMKLFRHRSLLPAITLASGLFLSFGCQSSRQAEPGHAPTSSVDGHEGRRDIAELARDIESDSREMRSKAIKSLYRLTQANKGKDMTRFSPAVEPLISMIGWGGIARRESKMAADILAMVA